MSDALKMYLDPVKRTFMFDHSTQAIGCDRKIHWSRFRQLRKKVHGEATYFGKCIHKFVELYWLGKEFDEAIEAYYTVARAEGSPLIDDPDSEELRTVQRGFDCCVLYSQQYKLKRLTSKPYILNGKPLVEIPFAIVLGQDSEGWTYIYCGRIDRVELRDGDRIWIVDTKTTTRFGESYWNTLRPNDQITGYAAGVKEILGVLPHYYAIDVIAIGKPRERVPKDIQALGALEVEKYKKNFRFEQGPTSRNAEEISDWWDNTFTEGIRLRKLWTDGGDNPRYWTRRTSQCTNYGGCDFRDICNVVVGYEPIVDALYDVQPWSPFDEENGVKEAEA